MGTAQLLPERYRGPRLVGRGGMGEIYRATDSTLGRAVAVKILAERYAENEDVRGRFTREALAAARLSGDPNTVTIYDVGEHEERPYIVMEYMGGGSLEQRLREGPCTPAQALEWLEQAARALDRAHAEGVVHRDVKPGNLLLDREGNVHVGDFGIASAAGMDSLTMTGTVMGTAGYLAPEQAQGERATPASDRYGLGVVAFELLTGTRPFEAESVTAEASAHVHAPIPSAAERNPSLPPEVDAVFERALAKDPALRYGSCAELVAALRDALSRAAGETRALAPVAPPPTRPLEPAPAYARPRRPATPLWPLLLAGLLVAAVGGVALAALLSGDGDGDRAGAAAPGTVVKTITARGTTVRETVTTQPAQQPSTRPPEEPAAGDPGTLNDQGFFRMQAGDYEGALPLLESAVAQLSGTGSLTEAYASYNLAYTRFQLGRCDGVLELLDRSESIQGERKEISRLRKDAEKRCED